MGWVRQSLWTGVLVLLAGLCPSPSSAETGDSKRFGDWELLCPTTGSDVAAGQSPSPPGDRKSTCRLQQAQAVNGGKDVVFLFNIVIQKGQPVAIISAPLNVYLPAGMDLKIDSGSTRKAVFETCNVSGCHGGFALNDALLGSLRNGRRLTVTLRDSKATRIPVNVSLNGIDAGYAALRAAVR